MTSKSPFKPSSPTATGPHLHSGSNWGGELMRSSPVCSAHQWMIVIAFHYYIWRPRGLAVKVCWASPASSRPSQRGRTLLDFQHFTSLQLCCITSPFSSAKHSHINPHPSLSSCGGCLTHQRNNAHHSTNVFNWQLEPINAEASSHGYGTVKYICAYSWMKIHFQQDLYEKCGNSVCHRPFSHADVWRLTHRTLPLPAPGLLQAWYSPWEVIISRLWKPTGNELAYLTSGYASSIYTTFFALQSLLKSRVERFELMVLQIWVISVKYV